MADIAVGDVTYALVNQRKMSDSRNLNRVRLSFGDGALTYPAAGIPISKGKLGCPTVIESMIVVDQGVSGYKFQYDQSAEKLVLIQSPARTHTHDIKVIESITANATVGLNGATYGKNSASNVTIVGANSATTGGVVSATLAAAAGVEPSAVAIAAQVIEVEVIGW